MNVVIDSNKNCCHVFQRIYIFPISDQVCNNEYIRFQYNLQNHLLGRGVMKIPLISKIIFTRLTRQLQKV